MSIPKMIGTACGALAVLCLAVLPAFAQPSGVEVTNAWARGTVSAQKSSGVFLDIRSSAAARLIGAASPVAAAVEIHNMSLEGGVMRMFPVKTVELPAGTLVRLAPGGYHVMLLGLRRQLKAGERIPLTLKVQGVDGKVQDIEAHVPVRDLASGGGGASHH